jgi:hypothetical protein
LPHSVFYLPARLQSHNSKRFACGNGETQAVYSDKTQPLPFPASKLVARERLFSSPPSFQYIAAHRQESYRVPITPHQKNLRLFAFPMTNVGGKFPHRQ